MPTVERGYVLFDETSQMYIRLHETLGTAYSHGH